MAGDRVHAPNATTYQVQVQDKLLPKYAPAKSGTLVVMVHCTKIQMQGSEALESSVSEAKVSACETRAPRLASCAEGQCETEG